MNLILLLQPAISKLPMAEGAGFFFFNMWIWSCHSYIQNFPMILWNPQFLIGPTRLCRPCTSLTFYSTSFNSPLHSPLHSSRMFTFLVLSPQNTFSLKGPALAASSTWSDPPSIFSHSRSTHYSWSVFKWWPYKYSPFTPTFHSLTCSLFLWKTSLC